MGSARLKVWTSSFAANLSVHTNVMRSFSLLFLPCSIHLYNDLS